MATNFEKKMERVKSSPTDHHTHEQYHMNFGGTYIKDLVFGANDGIVTTFAVVAGVAGARLEDSIVLILGFANLVADGLSMAVGNYLGTKSEQQYVAGEREIEEWEVEHMPEEEREEMRHIYRRKGFTGVDLERAVTIITADKKRWVDEMMWQELGIESKAPDTKQPYKNGLVTFTAFVAAGFVPLVPYVFGMSADGLISSSVMACVTLFAVGSARSIITKKRWWLAGLEMLMVGGIAAGAAYGVGAFIDRLI